MLLGTAKTLAGMTDRFGGTVKFFFQHAEELNPGAAAAMIEAGCMEGVDFIYGFHVMNGRKGTIGITPGPATSSAGGWFLTVQGKGSHGSMPHHGVDPALCASMIVVALNHVVARNTDPDHFVVVNPGAIQSGSAPNVIPDTARIGCSIRVYDPEDLELVYRRADEVVEGICKAYGCTYEFERVPAYAVTVNDLKLVELGLAAARTALGGEEMAYEVKPSSGSEDFSAFANVVPGCFVQLMGGDASDGLPYMNHHPRFNIVEQPTLANGVRAEVQIVLAVLGDGALEGHKNQPVRG
jgi:amidohydrolase